MAPSSELSFASGGIVGTVGEAETDGLASGTLGSGSEHPASTTPAVRTVMMILMVKRKEIPRS